MFKKIKKILTQSYPYEGDLKETLKSSAGIGVFLFLFFVFFKPFGLDRASTSTLIYFSLLNAVISNAIAASISIGGQFLFSKKFNQESWRLVDEIGIIIVILFSIGLGVTSIVLYMEGLTYSLSNFAATYLEIQYNVLLVSVFPVAGLLFFNRYKLLKEQSKLVDELNQQLTQVRNRSQKSASRKNDSITLLSETGKESLRLSLKDLLFITSANNYIYVYYRTQNKVKTELLRNKLKEIENRVKGYPFLFRCHRTCIVNVDNVLSVEKNAQGYKLNFANFDKSIPVARSKAKKLQEILQTMG